MAVLASVITHPSCMAECPELNKFQYNYLLYSSEMKQLNCWAPAFAASFYLAPKFIYNEIVLLTHLNHTIFISAPNKHSL